MSPVSDCRGRLHGGMSMHRQVPRAMLCAVLLVASAVMAGAQQFTGGVRGEVRDQNGVIPGVTVSLVNEATNISREVVTNPVGQYNFPAVAPGTYTLKTQLTGYKTYESKGLIVGTQQFITLDVTLQVGALEESITVTGQSPLIDTSTASTGGVDAGPRPTAPHRPVPGAHRRPPRQGGPRVAPPARPQRVPHRRARADGDADRPSAVQPPAGSDQRVARLDGRRRHPRQQL